ncbi:MAG: hypothetical protein RBS92_06890, partial [Candidatus Cloacimonadales bacterium]|nr:hypothetical protein [Candidatus Cloacimonadales bacterium]
MGRTVLIMVVLLTIVVGAIVLTINYEQAKLVDTLSDDNDMNLAKFISNTYAHNTIKDIRDAFVSGNSNLINNLTYYPSKYVDEPRSGLGKVLGIDNASIDVSIYNASFFPNYRQLEPGREWGVISIGRVNAAVCTTTVVYKRMPYSEFGFFTDNFPTDSYFGDGEVIDGPAYINGKLRVGTVETAPTADGKSKNAGNPHNIAKWFNWGSKRDAKKEYPADAGPLFTDLVYVTAKPNKDYQTYSGGGNLSSPANFINYYNGFVKEAPTYEYPKIAMPNDQFNIAQGLRNTALNPLLENKEWIDMYITLQENVIEIKKSYNEKVTTTSGRKTTTTTVKKTDTNTYPMNTMGQYNNLIYIGRNNIPVYVKGVLEGQLTIATEGTLYADGSIYYKSVKNNLAAFKQKCIDGEYEPLPNNDQSILGLLAAKRFVFKANAENRATDHPIVMANIFTKGMIEITEGQTYNNYTWGSKYPDGRHFIVYGSRVQGELQPGTF